LLDVLYVSWQVLRGVSIHIKPGESVAVVGASGSGKSTILKLVTRLYDAVGGAVKVNGVNVKDLTTDSLRAAVAVVPQDTVLFNDTILQNIRWVHAKAGSCCSRQHMAAACEPHAALTHVKR
jgi:ATP-binding cassette subfamily B protein